MAGSKTRKALTAEDVEPKKRLRRKLSNLKAIASAEAPGKFTGIHDISKGSKRLSGLANPQGTSSSGEDSNGGFIWAHQADKQWSQMHEDLLAAVVNKLPPRSVAAVRLVCISWRRAVEAGLQTLRSDNKWGPAELITAVNTYPGLESLDLQNSSSLLQGVAALAKMSKLRHLRLASLIYIRETDLRPLSQLVTLSLPQSCALRTLGLNGFYKLQRLDLTGCVLLEAICVSTFLPDLTCLSLRECHKVGSWKFFKYMPALESLDVAYCMGFSDAALKELAISCPYLGMLGLLYCRGISDSGMPYVLCMEHLKDVYLDGCSFVTDTCMRHLAAARPDLNMIRFSL